MKRGKKNHPHIFAEPQWSHEEAEGSLQQANIQDQEWEDTFRENLGQQE